MAGRQKSMELPTSAGIYFIKAGSYGYVGQATNLNARLTTHIYNAYYGRQSTEDKDIYDHMRKRRMQNIEVYIYPVSEDCGIPDLSARYTNFHEEWTPAGGRLSNAKNPNVGEILDFAEIYHILYHIQNGDCILTNKEVGGQVTSWTKAGSIVEGKDTVKMVTSKTPPKEAYQTFLRGSVESMKIAEVTKEIFDDFFADDWAKRVMDKYLGENSLASQYVSGEEAKSILEKRRAILSNSINDKNSYKPWSRFFDEDIIPYLEKNLAGWVAKGLDAKTGTRTIKAVKSSATQDLSKLISEKFLKQRANLAKDIASWLFSLQKGHMSQVNISTKELVENFDFKLLTDYIVAMIEDFIVEVKDGFKISSGEKHKDNVRGFKPVRFSVVWKNPTLHKDRKGTSLWITNMLINSVTSQSEWLKARSILLFDHFVSKAKQTQIMPVPRDSEDMSFEGDEKRSGQFRPFYTLDSQDWLSAKVHSLYGENAPGYFEGWFEFYRPMISLWRAEHNKTEFKTIKKGDKDYLGLVSNEDAKIKIKRRKRKKKKNEEEAKFYPKVLYLYSQSDRFVTDITNKHQIKIY